MGGHAEAHAGLPSRMWGRERSLSSRKQRGCASHHGSKSDEHTASRECPQEQASEGGALIAQSAEMKHLAYKPTHTALIPATKNTAISKHPTGPLFTVAVSIPRCNVLTKLRIRTLLYSEHKVSRIWLW